MHVWNEILSNSRDILEPFKGDSNPKNTAVLFPHQDLSSREILFQPCFDLGVHLRASLSDISTGRLNYFRI